MTGCVSGGIEKGFKVLLDTSAFLLIINGVDVFSEVEKILGNKPEFITLDAVVNELIKLASRAGSRRGTAARLALSRSLRRVGIVETGRPEELPDRVIVEYALRNPEVVVVTLDRDLRNRLRSLGIRTLTWWSSRKRFTGV